MAGNTKGINIEIGGDVSGLKKALSGVNKDIRTTESELKQVERLLKLDPKNTELLAQKQQLLSNEIGIVQDKLTALKKAQEETEEAMKNGTEVSEEGYRALQREIIATEQKLQGLTDELGNIDNSTEDIDNVGDSLQDAGKSAEESSGGFTIMKGALADLVANAISKAISIIGDFIGSLFELTEATEEYRSMQGKLAGSAETFGYSVDFANSKYQNFYKYLGDDQMATNAITNLMGLGTTTESISKIADGAIGVWASYGDSIPIEPLTESINETILCGKVTGTFADTINWAKTSNEELSAALAGNSEAQKAYNQAIANGMPAEDAFNEALKKTTSEQERADIVAKFLNSTYGESKKVYDEMSGSITAANDAELKLKETQAQLGETMAPVNTIMTEMKARALEVIAPLVEKVATGFMNMVNWLKEHPAVMHAVIAVVTILTTAFTILAGVLAIQGLIAGITKAFALLNTTMLANPIVLIVAAIAGLVAAFVYLWNNCESFRNFWIGLWENVKEVAMTVWEAIKGFFQAAWDFIQPIWNSAVEFFTGIWEGIKQVFSVVGTVLSAYFSAAWEAVKLVWSVVVDYFKMIWENIKQVFSVVKSVLTGDFSGAWEGIKNIFSNVKEFFSGVWEKIKNAFNIGDMLSIGQNLLEGLWNGINNKVEWLKGCVKGVVDKIKSWFTGSDGFDTHSPSKWSEKIMDWVMKGLAIGADNGAGGVYKTIDDIAAKIKEKISGVINMNDIVSDRAKLEYELWELTDGETSTEEERRNKELEYLEKQYAEQGETVAALEAEMYLLIEAYGGETEESEKLRNQLLQEQIAYEKLGDEIERVQGLKSGDETTTGTTVATGTSAGQGPSWIDRFTEGLKIGESLGQFGYTPEQQQAYAYAYANAGGKAFTFGESAAGTPGGNNIEINQNFYSPTASPAETSKATKDGLKAAELEGAL